LKGCFLRLLTGDSPSVRGASDQLDEQALRLGIERPVGEDCGLDWRVPRLVGEVARPAEQLLLADRDDRREASAKQGRQAVPATPLAAQELAQAIAPDAGLDLDAWSDLPVPSTTPPEPAPELVGLRFPRLGFVELGLAAFLRRRTMRASFLSFVTCGLSPLVIRLLIPAVLTLSDPGRRPHSLGSRVARRCAARTVEARHLSPPCAVGTPAAWSSAAIRL